MFGVKIAVMSAQKYLPAVFLCFGPFGVASQLFVRWLSATERCLRDTATGYV